jgi:hypothetical protein
LPRKRDIEAAIAAHNSSTDSKTPLLPPTAVQLLAVMFRRSSVCQRRLDDLTAEGFDRTTLRRLLRALIEAGLLSRERGPGLSGVNVYQLHLPPRRQP